LLSPQFLEKDLGEITLHRETLRGGRKMPSRKWGGTMVPSEGASHSPARHRSAGWHADGSGAPIPAGTGDGAVLVIDDAAPSKFASVAGRNVI
jgi:hypothetical protein